MMNYYVVIGRLTDTKKDGKNLIVKLAVNRQFKNIDGVYETDFINCGIAGGLLKSVLDYCKRGDLLGIRGHIESLDGNNIMLQADKVTFLSSGKVTN